MGYFQAASPNRSSVPSSYRGRSSPSPRARQAVSSASAGAGAYANGISSNNVCRPVSGGSVSGYMNMASPQRQRQYYNNTNASHGMVTPRRSSPSHAHSAAPQDRASAAANYTNNTKLFRHQSSMNRPPTPHRHTFTSANNSGKKRSSISPSDNKKYKMELCKNFLKGGCPFGSSCHFAHGVAELNRPDPMELVKEGKLLYVCEIWCATGACPCGQRCKYLHDPNLSSTCTSSALSPPSTPWLRLNTKPSKKEPHIIPDPTHWHRMNQITQINPIVDPWVWSKCRPDEGFNCGEEVEDTCDLVWNRRVSVFDSAAASSTSGGNGSSSYGVGGRVRLDNLFNGSTSTMSYSNIVRKSTPTSQEATTLSITYNMLHSPQAFLYAPTHCIHGQPCMILQTRYFRVVGGVKMVEEVSVSEYERCGELVVVKADEVVFDSMGKRSCNHSIWFDTQFTPYQCRKTKKSDKSDKNMWSSHKNDHSLFCMPNNDEFLQKLPATPPYMIMQPYGQEGFELMKRIIQYRIDELTGNDAHAVWKMSAIKEDFVKLANDLKRWKLPRTKTLNHLERGEVNTSYIPSDEGCISAKLYHSLVVNMKSLGEKEKCWNEERVGGRRLDAFMSLSSKEDNPSDVLPVIKRIVQQDHVPLTVATETWQDLLMGVNGKWEQSMHTSLSEEGKKVNSCASPSSSP